MLSRIYIVLPNATEMVRDEWLPEYNDIKVPNVGKVISNM